MRKATIGWVVLTLAGFLTVAGSASAVMNRFWMASQQDFGAKRGFYLDFENESGGTTPCTLGTLKLYLAVADGKNWTFLTAPPAWQFDHDYAVKAVVGPSGSRLWLDGVEIAKSESGWQPDTGQLLAGYIPGWAHGPADYLIVQKSLQITPSLGKAPQIGFSAFEPPPLGVRLFEPQSPRRQEGWHVDPRTTLTITATVRIEHYPANLHADAPFIDRYGQAIAARWSGKINSDAQLKQTISAEAAKLKKMPAPAGYDAYGGSLGAGWQARPNGFYQVARHQGVWWLISPQGHPCFYTSMTTAPCLTGNKTPISDREFLFAEMPPKDGLYGPVWSSNAWGENAGTSYISLSTANLIRKFGVNWQQQEQRLTEQRLRSWGFSGLGKWCDTLAGVTDIPVLGHRDVPNVARHPDIFDPAVRTAFETSLRKQIAPRLNDPRVLGWSLGNEYDEIITHDETADILKKGTDVPAKRALVDYALETIYGGDMAKMAAALAPGAKTRAELYAAPLQPPADALEQMRRFYADRYYDYIYRTIKKIDPHHLYFGFWISIGWWENEEDWRMIAKHCDVIGYDRYAYDFADADLLRLMRAANKPVFCGEFAFVPQYKGNRGFGLYDNSWVADDTQAGEYYQRWLDAAARNPYCVGVSWFEYRDEPLTGRGPGRGPDITEGEHYAFGLVDVTDRPKWDLVSRMRAANLSATATRLKQGSNASKRLQRHLPAVRHLQTDMQPVQKRHNLEREPMSFVPSRRHF